MRIAGLHLRAYGHFTGCALKFGAAPGLHVVYGHNEAGKSTTLRALSSVLFGYPHEVVDGFKHGAKDIAIGVDLVAADGRRLSFVRKRRGRHALTADDGSAVDEGTVGHFLGGVSQDVFEKVFALDHRRLREHAQALLADGGSLGFSLAEAGSGIAGLKAVLDKLKAERTGLFLATGTKPKLNQAIAEFTRLRRDAKQCIVSPAEYRSREKRLQEAGAELQGLRERLKAIESSTVRLQRMRKNLPLQAEHRVLTERLEMLADVPILPPEFAQQRIKARTDLDAAREDIDVASAAIDDLENRIAAISVDNAVLAWSAEIERLAEKRPVIEDYESDIPKREAARGELYGAVAGLMAGAELGGGTADLGLLPSALQRKAVRKLADDGRKLAAQLEIAQGNAETAARLLNKARDRLKHTPEPCPIGGLSRALTAADRLGDITADITSRTQALERKARALKETIVGLGSGADSVTALRELAVPPEKTEMRYAELLAEADREIKDAHDAFERLNRDIADIEQRIVALKTTGDVATEDDLMAARSARDQGWALVRGLYVDRRSGLEETARRFAPDGRIADVYEEHVREADRSVDVLRARVGESTELSLLRRRMADQETKKAAAIVEMNALGARRDAVLSDWRALWPAGLITVQSPGEMIDWLERRAAAIATADELEEESDAVKEQANRERDGRQALASAMSPFGADPGDGSLEDLRDRARSIIAEVANAKSQHDRAEAAVRELSEQKIEADEAADKLKSRIDNWTKAWRATLLDIRLPADQTIDTASATLEVVNELDLVKSRIDELTHRIEKMRADRDAFRDAVAGVAAALPGAPRGAAAEVCRWLEERLRAAQRAAIDRRNLKEQLEIQATNRDRANGRLRRSRIALDALCAQAGCADADQLAEIERKSAEKQGALSAREKIETRVREDGGGRDFADLFNECNDAAADEIPADLISLGADREETEAGIERLMSERATLQAEFEGLLGQNQAADLAQEAAAVEAEIADAVEDYVDLTVQETLLRAAIDVYRDRNQGPILTRAKDLFVQLTDGAYSGLRADVEKGETILVVEDASRGSLEIDALSDGTVDALYLALRLAVVQEHNATHEPLPFVADDLLLNLDNHRAQAALRTLAAMATSSQVLLFTHHAHMVELARIAVPPSLLAEHNLSPAIRDADDRRAVAR